MREAKALAKVKSPNVVGHEPARLRERIHLGRVSIALGEGGAAECDPTVAVDANMDAVQRDTVVHAAAGGFAHTVCPQHREPHRRSPFRHTSGRRAAADQYRVQLRQRCARGRVGQRLVELGGHQRRIAPAGAHPRNRCGQIGHIESGRDGHRRTARNHTAHQHLQAGDVMDGQGEQPTSRAAKAAVCRLRAGGQGGRGEHCALRSARRT